MSYPTIAAAFPGAEAALAAEQQMPRSAELRNVNCQARIRVSVDANGLITRYVVLTPCREPILSRATENLLLKVGQLPPPPGRRAGTFDINISWPPER
jgi:outer membrane biosynthesis protein TonB